jgi:hypothetical protein
VNAIRALASFFFLFDVSCCSHALSAFQGLVMCDEIQCEKLNSVIDVYTDHSFQLKYLSVATVCYDWPMPTEFIFQWFSIFWGGRREGGLCLGFPSALTLLNTSVTRSVNRLWIQDKRTLSERYIGIHGFSRLVCMGLPRHTGHLMLVSPPRGVSNDWCLDTSCSNEWWCRQVLYLLMRWHERLT